MKRAAQMPAREWLAPASYRGALRYYDPFQKHELHEHGAAHVSILLSGSLEESTRRNSTIAEGCAMRVRREGFIHAVSFGRSGALVLTLPAPDDGASDADGAWLQLARPTSVRHVLTSLFGGPASDVETASAELMALAKPAAPGAKLAPAWLRAAREQIQEEPAETRIADLSAHAGVHRVHFARQFLAVYGAPPSVFRRRAMLTRALAAILGRGGPLGPAAAEAGFSDQAHMTRTFVEFLGITPGRLQDSLH